ncbi:MAG: LON peptidase substrate-binding domain-containing protein [Pelagibacterales bacterium]|nr:LON peptidase substrate-binding domain-containing protein [Pelagibacterales bacterium]
MKKEDLPKKIAVFPLSNFIIFPKTSVPLNIFEPRYIDMINDAMKTNKFVGMIQPKKIKEINDDKSELHEIGCLGKVTSFRETEDSRYLIELKGIARFKIIKEIRKTQ